MCGRVIQSSGPVRYAVVDGLEVRDSRLSNYPRRWNGAPSQDFLVIRQNHRTGERSLDLLKWGLIPYWCEDPKGGRKPINAKSETVVRLPSFREAYRKRRCILPVDGFYEWQATKRGKRPYAIAMKDRSPFGIAVLWENWKDPTSGQFPIPLPFSHCGPDVFSARLRRRAPSFTGIGQRFFGHAASACRHAGLQSPPSKSRRLQP